MSALNFRRIAVSQQTTFRANSCRVDHSPLGSYGPMLLKRVFRRGEQILLRSAFFNSIGQYKTFDCFIGAPKKSKSGR